MIEEFFNDYTAGEFLNWLSKEYADEYIKENIIEDENGDTVLNSIFDIERLKQNFSRRVHRYVVIKRGFRFYIHDERNCADIMMFRYTEANHDEILEHVNNMCDDLNKGNINFIGRKYRCD